MVNNPLLRRVVVTGIGAVTPLGATWKDTWKALIRGGHDSGVVTLEEALVQQSVPNFDWEWSIAKTLACQVAAPVRWNEPYDTARTARFVQFALLASIEATQHANLLPYLGSDPDTAQKGSGDNNDDAELFQMRRERCGVCIGSGMSSVREIFSAMHTIEATGSARRLSPHFVPKVLANSAAGRVAMSLNLQGPNHAPSTACAAGAHAIGDAMRCIQYGSADIMLAGGSEACIDPISMAGFSRLRALSTSFNDCPKLASRPFDSKRDGFVMGEGAGILVLEELDHALQRGAPILCELRGYGLSGDAHHVTAPDPNGMGAARAMKMALGCDDDLEAHHVDYVNAHATSTPLGDDIEASVISRILGQSEHRSHPLHVSSTKGATGHMLGAAGAVEAAVSCMTLVDQAVPPTLNLDPATDLNINNDGIRFVTEETLETPINVSMSNSFGFGGTNASLIFTKYKSDSKAISSL
jgi:3-oxoacyl-[acyl-carrier-protein] synthase II